MTPSRLLLCAPHDVDAIGQLVEQYHASTILLTPWSAMRLVQNGVPERYDLTSLRTLAFASAALPACTARGLLAASPEASITTAYAQGEAVPAVVLGVFDPDRPLCLGREANGTAIRIVDEQRRELPDGELGEIVMFSSAPKRLYLDDERNRVTHVDGWTYTRDLGRREGDGTITLFDRIADVIHAESGPVSSLAIEQALYDHPDIVEVAVVGIGEPDHQQIAAFVVRRPGGARLADLRGFAEHRLEVGHRPTVWRFPRTLPRGVTGKVSKLSLRSRLTDLGIAHDRRRVSA